MLRRIRKNKRGSLQDMILIGVIILFFSIVVLFGFKFTSEIDSAIQSNSAVAEYDTGNHARSASTALKAHYPGIIDNVFLFFAIGLAIATIALAALVRVHPVFIAFYFIGLVLVIFFSGMFSNIYQEMAANSQLAAEATQLVFITNILEYLPFIVGIFGTLLMIVMYKSWKDGQ